MAKQADHFIGPNCWDCFKMTQIRLIQFQVFLAEIKLSIQKIKMNKEQANIFLRSDDFSSY